MENFSSFVRSVEEQLNRKLCEKEWEFLIWLYETHQMEQKLKA
ncbi:hypothetical protein [Aquibacillus albus]|uniref:BH0509 family protein n=1 Tax=Aquibacillus albus TaxID=1168171 RepID=A0ABS2MX89_9BACI|nr:hypothetical protein [Aquibacillus albus]MBM7570517.1 hypothetical protein [Aquibacillus albus]